MIYDGPEIARKQGGFVRDRAIYPYITPPDGAEASGNPDRLWRRFPRFCALTPGTNKNSLLGLTEECRPAMQAGAARKSPERK
jgi:hypothetical protein